MPTRRYSLFACTRPADDYVSEVPNIEDIRQLLTEQLKCLESRLEIQVAMVTELQDFFRRRAEVELEYGKSLEKLAQQTFQRHKAEKQRREQWPLFSSYSCWENLLKITKDQSRDHNTLSKICNDLMVPRLGDIIENSHRIFRECRDIGLESHADILKVLDNLQSDMKTYHVLQAGSKDAEQKLKDVESQKMKLEQQLSGKQTSGGRKLKSLESNTKKKQEKYSENKLKALKARNEYLLRIESANAAINKYFSDNISDLMDCMDLGYHNSVGRAMLMFLSTQDHFKQSHQKSIDLINECVSELDARADKQKFMERHNQVFMLPKKFEFQPCRGDEVRQISAQKKVQEKMISRYQDIDKNLDQHKVENDETWKTLEAAEESLMEMIHVKDYDVSSIFLKENPPPKSPHEAAKRRSDRLDTEEYYLKKFRKYLLCCNRISRIQAQHCAIQKSLGEDSLSPGAIRPPSLPPKPKKRRIGRTPQVGQPKLFGGSLEEYIEATNQEIPLVIKSGIKVINLYGMHHQGIFRVSGSQVEINEFKIAFERGEDPLVDIVDASDINSVAGVLKLYFRELREPLFPLHLFEELINCSRLDEQKQKIEKIRDLLLSLPRSILIVMRYLFAFLSHLSEFSDENMMEPYNLAICFGPTLLPIPPDRDQVAYQGNVNDLIKTIIVSQEDIFPYDGGEVYEKYILEDRDTPDQNEDETSSIPSDDEESSLGEVFEATALYEFDGRNEKELSFKKGDVILIFNQVSEDWWEGCLDGKEGLIPDKYVSLKRGSGTSEDQKSHSSEEDKTSSTSSLHSKPRHNSDPSPVGDSMQSSIVSLKENDVGKESKTSSSPKPAPRRGSMELLSKPPLPMIEEAPKKPDKIDFQRQISAPEASPEDVTIDDIDTALAEVMSGIKSLEMQQKQDKRGSGQSLKSKQQTSKHTPDLVLDLPEDSNTPSSNENSESESPTMSAAETFAKCNQGTLKKATTLPRNTTDHKYTLPDDRPKSDTLSSSAYEPSTLQTFSTFTAERRTPTPTSALRLKQTDLKVEDSPVLPPLGSSPTVPPPIAEKPKPPLKSKPPVMKKPQRPDLGQESPRQ